MILLLGNWNAGPTNIAAGYTGPIFGPTSLVINNECNGEDPTNPGGPGESRRIKAFKWFCGYFGVPYGANFTLTCKSRFGIESRTYGLDEELSGRRRSMIGPI